MNSTLKVFLMAGGLILPSSSIDAKILMRLGALYVTYKIGESAGACNVYKEHDSNKAKFDKHQQQAKNLEQKINELDLSALSAQEIIALQSAHPKLFFLLQRLFKRAKDLAVHNAKKLIDHHQQQESTASSSSESKQS